eukprot:SAG31_NODE_24549_length_479_cov_0.792105_1_plen_27_part_01
MELHIFYKTGAVASWGSVGPGAVAAEP